MEENSQHSRVNGPLDKYMKGDDSQWDREINHFAPDEFQATTEEYVTSGDLAEMFRSNPQFRLWLLVIAATATVIGLFLLWIFTQALFFRKPTFCCLSGGFFAAEISQIRLGRASLRSQEQSPAPDLPPSYSACRFSPPTYEETVRMDTMQTAPLVTENVQFLTSRQGQVIQTV